MEEAKAVSLWHGHAQAVQDSENVVNCNSMIMCKSSSMSKYKQFFFFGFFHGSNLISMNLRIYMLDIKSFKIIFHQIKNDN